MSGPLELDASPRPIETPRAAGVAGLLFALLFGFIVVLLRRVVPSDPHAAGAWLSEPGNRQRISLALGLIPFCGIFFLWFMGAVRSRIGEAEDKFFATVFFGSGLLFVAMIFMFGALFAALIGFAGLHHGHPPLAIWQLGRETTFNLATVYSERMGGVFMIASSTIALRLKLHNRVIIYLGFLGAVLLLFASSTIPWLQIVFPFWVLLVSINILVLSVHGPQQPRGAAHEHAEER